MSGRRLVLLRHGRTAWNHLGRVQGQLEVPLDDVGRAQALAAACVLATLEPRLLWSSDLARTRETTQAVVTATGLEPTYDCRLREFYFGDREGLTHIEYAEADPVAYEQFRRGNYDATPGAERTTAVRDRMVSVLGDLLAALSPGQTGLAVSHGAALRVAVGAMVGWPDDQFRSLRGLTNCGWVVLDEDPDGARLRLSAYNATV